MRKHRRLTPFGLFLVRMILIVTVGFLCGNVICMERIHGNQMNPDVRDGDLCVFVKTGDYQTGDLVAYEDLNGKRQVGRISVQEGLYRIINDDGASLRLKKEAVCGEIIFLFRRRGFVL